MDWVVDCSFTAALFLPDESSFEVNRFFASLEEEDSLWVPVLWWYEITNVLTVAERKKLINRSDIAKILSLYSGLNLQTDNSYGFCHSSSVHEIAHAYHLSAYDATYLELVIRKGTKLASFDKQLLVTATRSGMAIYRD